MEELNITYQQAQDLVKKYITEPITKLHLRETEVFMRALAKKFNEDEEKWGIIGLLHDIDWDLTKNNPSEHCIKAQEILKKAGASDFLIENIISHGYNSDFMPKLKEKQRSSEIQYCLAAAETLTGIIIASALVQPDKKLQSVSLESLKKKFKNKSFAAKCSREIILECEKADISLDNFLQIGLSSLQGIASEVGL
ncbi:MAG: HD domain-containing protein [Candidatus Shapirobacteria bacterium]|nr:HD domain-containing protein [Candidatus Shapirobacteria bacterium]